MWRCSRAIGRAACPCHSGCSQPQHLMALRALDWRPSRATVAHRFDYATAFDRNIGWLTDAEQESLRHKRVAIAGMGGVGGFHLTTLARLGVGKFNIADLDF